MRRLKKPRSKRRVAQARAKLARKIAKLKAQPISLAKSSRDKVRAHRIRLRAAGLRPLTIWVPDVRSHQFAAEARRHCRLAKKSPHAAADQAWVDSMSDWSGG